MTGNDGGSLITVAELAEIVRKGQRVFGKSSPDCAHVWCAWLPIYCDKCHLLWQDYKADRPIMDIVQDAHAAIMVTKESITGLTLQLKTLITETQGICLHPRAVECDHLEQALGGVLKPLRLCTDCGLEEEGWGCGYTKLREAEITCVNRQELYRLRL